VSIHRHLFRLYDTLYSRGDADIEWIDVKQPTTDDGRIRGRVRFHDGSVLVFRERVTLQGHRVRKSKYAYHYQRADGKRIFRYDNASHYPDLPGFPKHKHEDDRVIPAPAPDLSKVLREIDGYLYPSG